MIVALADLILIGLVILNIGFLWKFWDYEGRVTGLEELIIAFMEFMEEAE